MDTVGKGKYMAKELGKIEHIDIKSVWPNEERDFTPWVKENISKISALIGEDIEDVSNEVNVGNYSADLVGKIAGTDDMVVIENQYGETNHDHLGKLLTYLSGKGAKIGIWIAETFREEHIATLDYLNNNIKQDGPSLFGIKIEVKKIGDSLPAPELVVVVKPNEYQKEVSKEVLSEAEQRLQKVRLEFFTQLADKYKQQNPSWNKVKASPQHWLSFGAGKSGFSYSWLFRMANGWHFAIELYIDVHDREENKRILKELEQMHDVIEKELGFGLDFQELPDARASRIEISKQTSGPITKLSETEKEELIKWGIEKMSIFSKVLTKYIRQLE